jgi:predicted membrane GTPase involved in stress response
MLSTSLITSIIIIPSSSQSAEHGFLRGKKKITSATASASNEDVEDKSSNRRTLMDLIIETINKCSEDFDEGVQVQVLNQSLSSNLTDCKS